MLIASITTFLITSIWNIIQHFDIGIWHGLGNFLSDCQWYLAKNYFGHDVVNTILPIREKIHALLGALEIRVCPKHGPFQT